MAKADQLKALIRTHAEGDDERFYAIAMQMAAQAARQGQVKFAQDLRDLVDEVRGKNRPSPGQVRAHPIPIVQPRGELAGLISATFPKTLLSDMSLTSSVEQRLRKILSEQKQRRRIEEFGLSPIRKILLVGPPGTGKTMTANVLAGELGLPLFTIQLDGLITKFLGETAAKLRLIFEAIRETRGVYLFDEFDALGSHRGTKNEVGEIRRVLNSFLQFLETDASDSLIVAATNFPEMLDKALLRRFDVVVRFVFPDESTFKKVVCSRLPMLDMTEVNWHAVWDAARQLSPADLVRACEHVAKDALLSQSKRITTTDLVAAIEDRRNLHDL
jgi:SpoVK/Ycf46/Vps4 family AAA+-type ATPase